MNAIDGACEKVKRKQNVFLMNVNVLLESQNEEKKTIMLFLYIRYLFHLVMKKNVTIN